MSEDDFVTFVDYLTLVYHEARHVGKLFAHDQGLAEKYRLLRDSLPTDRDRGWAAIQQVRRAALEANSAERAINVFYRKFEVSLDDLVTLYQNGNWKHWKEYGGHAWECVTILVKLLSEVLATNERRSTGIVAEALRGSRHNNGQTRAKLTAMDQALSWPASGTPKTHSQ